MARYLVSWEIDIHADSPDDAARQAFAHMQRPGTSATVFDVLEYDSNGQAIRVDINELTHEETLRQIVQAVVQLDVQTDR